MVFESPQQSLAVHCYLFIYIFFYIVFYILLTNMTTLQVCKDNVQNSY